MYSKIFINLILIFSLVLIQLSFISGLPAGLDNLNLILVILIFILSLISLNFAVWWVIGIGFLLDTFSFLPFGTYMFCLFFTVIITNFLLINFFTNRSLYSFFALVISSTLIYELLLNSTSYIFNLLTSGQMHFILDKVFLSSKFTQIILNLIVTVIIFYLSIFISNKFKPVFLVKYKWPQIKNQ